MNDTQVHPPIHPGEILYEEFLAPLGITQYRLAEAIGIHRRRINEIVHGTRAITIDTALRLARALGTSDTFWINLQNDYEIETVRAAQRDEYDRIVCLNPAA